MEPLLVYPDPPPPVLSQGLDLAGDPWTAVGTEADVDRLEPVERWPGAALKCDELPIGRWHEDARLRVRLLLVRRCAT